MGSLLGSPQQSTNSPTPVSPAKAAPKGKAHKLTAMVTSVTPDGVRLEIRVRDGVILPHRSLPPALKASATKRYKVAEIGLLPKIKSGVEIQAIVYGDGDTLFDVKVLGSPVR